MKAISVITPGDHARLEWAEVPTPTPFSTEVLIDVTHTSVNRADLLQARGLYPPPQGASEILGLECAGHISALGQDAAALNPTLAVGQRVMALLPGGGYAERAVVDARCVMQTPTAFSDAQAGAFLETYLTAYLNIFRLGDASPGDTVLVHGGSGGVGTAAIHLCKALGVSIIVTTGSDDKADYCQRQGATHVINYTTGSFRDQVRALTDGRGVNVLLDCVGAAYLNDNLSCLAPDGALVVIGLMGGAKEELNLGRLLQKRIKLIGSTLRSLPLERKAALIQDFGARMGPALASGALLPEVFKIVDLQDAAEAHKIMKKGLHGGKIVMQVPR